MKVSFQMLRAMLLAVMLMIPAADALAAGKKGGSSGGNRNGGSSQMKSIKMPTVTRTQTGGSISGISKPKVMQLSPAGKGSVVAKDLKLLKIQDRNPPRTVSPVKGITQTDASKSIADVLTKRETIKPDLVLSKPSKSIADTVKKTEINPDLILSKPSKSIAETIKGQPGKPKPIDPGIGNGQPGKGNCTQQQWCNFKPKHCWWWFDYCHSIRFCQPNYCYPCNWNYVTCNYLYNGQVIENVKFYLGVQGMLLPGKGLGIETVDAGSPADLAGLKPGMVIVSANGVALTNEASLSTAMAQSSGVVQLQVTNDGAQQGVNVNVQLQRMIVRSF